jgi:hypothetical protein
MMFAMATQTIRNVPDSQVPVVTGRLKEGGATRIKKSAGVKGTFTITAVLPTEKAKRISRARTRRFIK